MRHRLLFLAVVAAVACNSDPSAPGAVELTMTPPSEGFQSTPVGTGSASVEFTVRNTGTRPSGVVHVTVVGPDAGQFVITTNDCATPRSLGVGGHCTFSAIFIPTGSPGARNASLQAQADPGGSTAAAITGIAPALSTTVTVAPGTHDFGYGGRHDFTVTNNGASPTGALVAQFTGRDFADFLVNSNGCNTSLVPGASCVITVQFLGNDLGPEYGWLNVASPTGEVAIAHLTGYGP